MVGRSATSRWTGESTDAQPATGGLSCLIVLTFLTVVTQVGSLAYRLHASAGSSGEAGPPLLSTLVSSTIAICLVTVPLASLGLHLGRAVGLGTPLLAMILQRREGAWGRLLHQALLAAPLGILVGLALLALRLVTMAYLPESLPAFGHRGVIGGLLVSLSAAIGEEVWIRLGVMTLLTWVLAQLARQSGSRAVAWVAVVLAATVFGLIHLPQLAHNGAATATGFAATMLGNGLVGVLCGWLYWRRSLLAAIIGHFAVDVMLHVLPAIR